MFFLWTALLAISLQYAQPINIHELDSNNRKQNWQDDNNNMTSLQRFTICRQTKQINSVMSSYTHTYSSWYVQECETLQQWMVGVRSYALECYASYTGFSQ